MEEILHSHQQYQHIRRSMDFSTAKKVDFASVRDGNRGVKLSLASIRSWGCQAKVEWCFLRTNYTTWRVNTSKKNKADSIPTENKGSFNLGSRYII